MASVKQRPEGLDQPLVPPPKRPSDPVSQVAYLLIGVCLIIFWGLVVYLLIALF